MTEKEKTFRKQLEKHNNKYKIEEYETSLRLELLNKSADLAYLIADMLEKNPKSKMLRRLVTISHNLYQEVAQYETEEEQIEGDKIKLANYNK